MSESFDRGLMRSFVDRQIPKQVSREVREEMIEKRMAKWDKANAGPTEAEARAAIEAKRERAVAFVERASATLGEREAAPLTEADLPDGDDDEPVYWDEAA